MTHTHIHKVIQERLETVQQNTYQIKVRRAGLSGAVLVWGSWNSPTIYDEDCTLKE